MDVHSPYRPPHPYGTQFTKPYSRNVVIEGNAFVEDRSNNANSLYPFWSETHDMTQEDIDFLIGLYDGAIRYTDARLPALLEALEWDPNRDVLILTADHGEALYEHQWWGHFATLAPTEVHVPLIMHYDGFTPARQDTPVSLLDLYPTIAELFGAEYPGDLKGVSLTPALAGSPVPPHDVYSETALANGANAAIISGEWWYVLNGNRSLYQPWHPWPYDEALYRFSADPQGRNNLVATESETANAMNERLRAFNPRWAAYTPDRIRMTDDDVILGENLLRSVNSEQAPPPRTPDGETWLFDVPVRGITYEADVVPLEPILLEIPYTLKSGRLHISLSPAAYRWPGTARESDVWKHVCTTPGTDQKVRAVVLPKGGTVTLQITASPGTRARVSEPALRTMQVDRVEPWPRAPNENPTGLDADPEMIQRMKALGYL